MPTDPRIKKSYDLTKWDFDTYPVWTWHDVEEDDMIPMDCDGLFKSAQDAIFAASTFTLNDGSSIPGVVGLRATTRELFLIEFFKPNGYPMVCSVLPEAQDRFPINELEMLFGANRTDIFPLTYTTTCAFGTTPLIGVVPREVYPQWLFPELKKWFDDRK